MQRICPMAAAMFFMACLEVVSIKVPPLQVIDERF